MKYYYDKENVSSWIQQNLNLYKVIVQREIV